MSGYVPRKVSNARMRTKTNQTGLKMQGSASYAGQEGIHHNDMSIAVYRPDSAWMDIQPDGGV